MPASDPNARAFTALYRAQVDFVWRVAKAMGVPDAVVDDVVHDVFFVVRRRIETLEPGRPVRPWLAAITRNLALHAHRKQAREQRRIAALAEPVPEPAIDEQIGLGEAAVMMKRFVDGLPADKRMVFVLCEVEGLSVAETARVLEENVNTTHARLRAARVELDRFVTRMRAQNRRASHGHG